MIGELFSTECICLFYPLISQNPKCWIVIQAPRADEKMYMPEMKYVLVIVSGNRGESDYARSVFGTVRYKKRYGFPGEE